ncbi:hypothetical protein [Phenylobacterium sp.]|uniref:hypothetical protein n=1 Tax=Phenylobacterium sp. TaxID=1871053 RepID=UPI002732E97C|nr:hypothetical protein [Phenylobacterium sp.]MDP3853233.1 hypothetical protein [Phenylobacterium sp.]
MSTGIVKVLGAVLCGVGVIWILQGIGFLPGSFMSGQMVWAAIGVVAVIVGLAMLGVVRRRRGRGSSGGGSDWDGDYGDSDGGGGGGGD